MRRLSVFLGIFLAGVIVCWNFVFFLYISDARSFSNYYDEKCENIVVLTGGRNRINHALNFVSENHPNNPKNIFISGVYSKTTLNDIVGKNKNQNEVNIILGKRAKNTFENAEEINEWVIENKIKKIILVTSDYHMRRSILLLENLNKELEIIPCASRSNFDFYFLKICLKEFHKTVYVFFKILFSKSTNYKNTKEYIK